MEWFELKELTKDPALAELSVGLEHQGPGKARQWALKIQAMKMREHKRILELRKGFTAAEAPELFEKDDQGNFKIETAEGLADAGAMSAEILAECLAGIRGVDGYEQESDRARLLELVQYFGISELLIQPAIKAQSLKSAQIFTPDPSDMGTSRAPSA